MPLLPFSACLITLLASNGLHMQFLICFCVDLFLCLRPGASVPFPAFPFCKGVEGWEPNEWPSLRLAEKAKGAPGTQCACPKPKFPWFSWCGSSQRLGAFQRFMTCVKSEHEDDCWGDGQGREASSCPAPRVLCVAELRPWTIRMGSASSLLNLNFWWYISLLFLCRFYRISKIPLLRSSRAKAAGHAGYIWQRGIFPSSRKGKKTPVTWGLSALRLDVPLTFLRHPIFMLLFPIVPRRGTLSVNLYLSKHARGGSKDLFPIATP